MSKRPTDAVIKSEVDRLLILANNPGNSTELARAMKRHARTEYHVKSIVQHLLDTEKFYPAPAQIREAAEFCLQEPPPKYRAPDRDCQTCSGTGFRHAIVNGASCAGVCDCRKVKPQ